MTQENQKLPENSYIFIQAFMINDLELSGNELITLLVQKITYHKI